MAERVRGAKALSEPERAKVRRTVKMLRGFYITPARNPAPEFTLSGVEGLADSSVYIPLRVNDRVAFGTPNDVPAPSPLSPGVVRAY